MGQEQYGDLRFDSLEYESKAHIIRYKGRPVAGLSERDIDLVCRFLVNPAQILSYDFLDQGSGRLPLQRAVGRIRKKIGAAGGAGLFLAVRGVGYRLHEPSARPIMATRPTTTLPGGAVPERKTYMPSGWLMAGNNASGHFSRRASGQRSRARGGDLFRGREAALSAVRGWLTCEHSPGRVLVVTGQPGAGKSAVIARTTLQLQDSGSAAGLAFHAQAATHSEFLSALAKLVGVDDGLNSRDGLLDALDRIPYRQLAIVVDALDEAATAADRRNIALTLRELMPGFL